jgi:hypothetical protein
VGAGQLAPPQRRLAGARTPSRSPGADALLLRLTKPLVERAMAAQ